MTAVPLEGAAGVPAKVAPPRGRRARTDRAQADRSQADRAQASRSQADRAQASRAQADRPPASFAAVFAIVTAGIAVVNLDLFIVNVGDPVHWPQLRRR